MTELVPEISAPAYKTRRRKDVSVAAVVFCIVGVHALATVALVRPSIVEGGRGGEIALHGIVTGAILTVAHLCVWGVAIPRVSRVQSTSLRLSIRFAALAAVVGFALGLMSRSALVYVIGDSIQWAVVPVVMLVFVRSSADRDGMRRTLVVLCLLLTLQQAREAVAIFGELVPGRIGRLHSVFWTHNVVAFIVSMGLALTAHRSSRSVFFGLVAAANLLVGLASGFRTAFLLYFLCGMAVALFSARPAQFAMRATVVVALSVAVLGSGAPIGSYLGPLGRPVDGAQQRLARLVAGEDGSTTNRGTEVSIVVDELIAEPGRLLTGFGNGASLPLTDDSPQVQALARGQESKHYIHVSFASALFRNGLMGVVALALLYVGVVGGAYRRWRDTRYSEDMIVLVAILAFAGVSPFFTFVPGDFLFAVLAGLCLTRRVDLRPGRPA